MRSAPTRSPTITARISRNRKWLPPWKAAAARAPASRWAASALFLAGNFYWVRLDRDRASSLLQAARGAIPELARRRERAVARGVDGRAQARARRRRRCCRSICAAFPGSPYTPDALYWLGRLAEEAGVPGLARSYYDKLIERFPQNYFETLALTRVRGARSRLQDRIPTCWRRFRPCPPSQKLGDTIPPAAAKRQARAVALQSIAFDASAELELRAAYAATGEPRLLLEAAQAAVDAGHCGAAIVTVRQIYPQLEAHPLADVPRPVWLAAYALPFRIFDSPLVGDRGSRSDAGRGTDSPGVRFRARGAFSGECLRLDAASSLDGAPPGQAGEDPLRARAAARSGLQRAGSARIYVAGLQKQFGNIESALAAYNAGEDRVSRGRLGRTIASRRNSSNRFRSPRRASTFKSSRATRTSIADSMALENESRKTRARGGR